MDKRKDPRYKRRIALQFWSVQDTTPRKGFTQNLSVRGVFVATNQPFKPGTRVFLEIPSGKGSLVLQGEVRYSARVDLALQRVKPSGMGIRLILTEELMAELLKLERSGLPIESEVDPADDDASATAPDSSSAARVYPVTFESPQDFSRSFERDIRFGGLFLPVDEPADQDETVTLEFRFAWAPELVVRIEALVVKRFTAGEDSAGGDSVRGMGVAFADPADVITRFEHVRAQLDQDDAGP
jgi:Tfp pilus assembly protein PilZ